MATRYKITIEYFGTNFVGWQKQNNGLSIQEAIENAIFQFSQNKVCVTASGRTDAGVHALGQVAHFDMPKFYPPQTITNAINHFTKKLNISILETSFVDQNFHSRFSAVKRHYIYKIINRHSQLTIHKNLACLVKQPLNINAMSRGAKFLEGTHDFTSFRASFCQAPSPIRSIDKIEIVKSEDEINISFSARSFLHHMVRNIVGTLLLVGIEKLKPVDIKKILEAKSRLCAGPTAPACGLYLTRIDY